MKQLDTDDTASIFSLDFLQGRLELDADEVHFTMNDESYVLLDAELGDEEDIRKTSGVAHQLLAYEAFIVSLEVLCEESMETESVIDCGEADVN